VDKPERPSLSDTFINVLMSVVDDIAIIGILGNQSRRLVRGTLKWEFHRTRSVSIVIMVRYSGTLLVFLVYYMSLWYHKPFCNRHGSAQKEQDQTKN
jgi:hypothetical protein